MNLEITLGDVLGYLLTYFMGVASGLALKFVFNNKSNSTRIGQNKNTVFNGDIVAGNKNDPKKDKPDR